MTVSHSAHIHQSIKKPIHMSNFSTSLTGASHTNDISSQISSASSVTKPTIGKLAGREVQAMFPEAHTGFSKLLKWTKKYEASSTQQQSVDVDTNLENYQPANPDGSLPDHRKFFDEDINQDPLKTSSKLWNYDYHSSHGEPSTLEEPLLSKEDQSAYKTADAEKTGGSPPAYEPPTLPTSVQKQ